MTKKQFKISSELLHEIEHLEDVKSKLGRSTILAFKCRYFDEKTKEWHDWELEIKHSYPIEEVKKTMIRNLSTRLENCFKNYSANLERIMKKDNEFLVARQEEAEKTFAVVKENLDKIIENVSEIKPIKS